MSFKPRQRVAYYEVDRLSDPAPAPTLSVGSVLVDRPRGPVTTWRFIDESTGKSAGWICGKRIGFARIDPETMEPVPEPALVEALAELRSRTASAIQDPETIAAPTTITLREAYALGRRAQRRPGDWDDAQARFSNAHCAHRANHWCPLDTAWADGWDDMQNSNLSRRPPL